MRQAGVEGVGSLQLLAAQLGCALLTGLAVLVMTRALTVAACFTCFGFFGPVLMVRRMQRRRQVALRTRLGSREARAIAPQLDALTAERVAEHGAFGGAMRETVAGETAAESAGHHLAAFEQAATSDQQG